MDKIKIDDHELLLHFSDLLSVASMLTLLGYMKLGRDQESLVQRLREQQHLDQNHHHHHVHPHLGIPTPYLFALCAGGTIAGLGTFHPENQHVASLLDTFREIYSRNMDQVTPFSVMIHLMTVSELAYEMFVVAFMVSSSFALLIMAIMRSLTESLWGTESKRRNATPVQQAQEEKIKKEGKKKKKIGKGPNQASSSEKGEKKAEEPRPMQLPNPNSIDIKWAILICIVVWFVTSGTIYSCSKVPSFVKPNSVMEALPLLQKCVPWRFGPYSLVSHALILGFTPYVFHACGKATGIAYSIYLGFLAQIVLMASWMVRAKTDPLSIYTTANIPARFHAFVLLAHIVLTAIFFLPKFLKDNSLLGIGSLVVVGIISAAAAAPQLANIENFRIMNTFIFTSIAMSAVLGGIAIVGANVLVFSIILRVHGDNLEQ